MNECVPRFLFLFQTLLLYVMPHTLKYWDRMLLKFIWDSKKTRVKIKTHETRGTCRMTIMQDDGG